MERLVLSMGTISNLEIFLFPARKRNKICWLKRFYFSKIFHLLPRSYSLFRYEYFIISSCNNTKKNFFLKNMNSILSLFFFRQTIKISFVIFLKELWNRLFFFLLIFFFFLFFRSPTLSSFLFLSSFFLLQFAVGMIFKFPMTMKN